MPANLPDEALRPLSAATTTGIYYGFAQVLPRESGENDLTEEERKVHPMVMSLGWNPFYKNERLSAVRRVFLVINRHSDILFTQEVHIMHEFKNDFYGNEMRVLVLGYIRPELDYTSRGTYTYNHVCNRGFEQTLIYLQRR